MLKNEKGQAVAPKTVTMTKKDFEDQGEHPCLLVRWRRSHDQ